MSRSTLPPECHWLCQCISLRRLLLASVIAVALSLQLLSFSHAAEHVIHISVDGLNAAMMQELIDSGKAPNLKRFQDEGVWTLNARADYTQTSTLPNHTCMFTGRPVRQPEDMPDTVHHGFTENKFTSRTDTLHKVGNAKAGYIVSVFDVVHNAGMSTALYASKDKFEMFDVSYNEQNGAEHKNGRDKIDVFLAADDAPPQFSRTLNDRFLADMAQKHFNYVFVHYRDCDSTGHALSWGSAGWCYAARNADAYIGEVFKLVESDEKLKGRTTIILNTDHGGYGYTHSTETRPDNYTIPVMVWGAGVGHGDLYEINKGTRTDPGDQRIDYTAKGQPIRNGDTGNLALSLLGLGPIPGSTINAKQDLRVSE
jgi:predicted AlkP superfamily pyrophosphatase or phosphodiesterase